MRRLLKYQVVRYRERFSSHNLLLGGFIHLYMLLSWDKELKPYNYSMFSPFLSFDAAVTARTSVP